ncbi:hypothetical protein BRC65_01440 [Halobacteriales archaeon QH_2_65_14]|nr:MAG: hypothetical protein BRC65_01440 [Halobacteriales archaeon QH_2_65_14]
MEQKSTAAASSFDAHERDTVSEAVVHAVADAEGTSPLGLPPLTTVVDPDALEMLFRNHDSEGCVTFSYHGYQVTVSSENAVQVTENADSETLH